MSHDAAFADDTEFVTSLYRGLFDREPDEEGLYAHANALKSGLKREELRRIFLESEEYAYKNAAQTGIDPALLYALCFYPMWYLNTVSMNDGAIVANGWAVGHHDHLALGEVTLNGQRATRFGRDAAGDVTAQKPWFSGNAQSFTATFDASVAEAEPQKPLRFSYVRGKLLEPFNRWQDMYFPLDVWERGEYVSPDESSLVRTQGNASKFQYVLGGTTVAHTLAEVVSSYFGKHIGEFKSICDWGAGSGRVAQAIRRLAPNSKITGLDIDTENVLWCKKNLKRIDFRVVPLLPPSSITAEQFDLLYGISVFTHLKADAFEAWRDELHRIVRPGGVVLVTLHCAGSLAMSGDHALVERTLTRGFDDSLNDMALVGKIPDETYYRATYLTPRRAVEILSERFRVKELLPLANLNEDLAVCERL